MKWRIAERKLNFVSKIMLREKSNIAKSVLCSEVLLKDVKGLAHECMSLSEDLGIPNVVYNSRKVGDRLTQPKRQHLPI